MQDRIARIEETSCTARPDHTTGSSTELLATSIFGPLPTRADYTCPSHAARNGSIPVNCARASPASPSRLLDHLIGAQQNRWGYGKTERRGGSTA